MPSQDQHTRFEAFAVTIQPGNAPDAVLAEYGLSERDGWHRTAWPSTWGDGESYTLRRERGARAISVEAAWELAHRLAGDARVADAEPLFVAGFVEDEPGELARDSGGFCAEDPDLPGTERLDWHLTLVRWYDAVATHFGGDPRRAGAGVVIAQPDTGYTPHEQLADRLDLARARSVLDEADHSGRDPLTSGFLKNPGHGTGTSSVVVSPHGQDDRRTPDVRGAAPGATLIPVRVTESVVLLGMQALSEGIVYATDAGAQVITMSIGGLDSDRLRDAVRYALRRGVIVLAAAGNCVRVVVYPAAIPGVVGVAGCNAERRPWRNSSRGPEVSLTGPAESVWRARPALNGNPPTAERGYGTSFAVATTAGAAAMWLARHGTAIAEHYPDPSLIPLAFRWCAMRSAERVATLPPEKYGAGLLDVAALLDLALPSAETLRLDASDTLRAVAVRGADAAAAVAGLPGRMSPSAELARLAADTRPARGAARADGGDGAVRTTMEAILRAPARPQGAVRRSVEREVVFHASTQPLVYERLHPAARGRSTRGLEGADTPLPGAPTDAPPVVAALRDVGSSALRAFLP